MQANNQNQIFRALKNAGNSQPDADTVRRTVEGLNAEDRAKLEQILSSPEKMRALLSSDAARELMNKLGKQGP